MKITEAEKINLEGFYQELISHPLVKQMDAISQHRGSTTYLHSCLVAKRAIVLALRSKKKCNLLSLIKASIFHDYFLYDWRKDRSKLKGHGHNHPHIAVNNADRDFGLTEEEKRIIETHMWPINFFHIPSDHESRLLSMADKDVSIKEALTSKRYKAKRMAKLREKITKLFD